MNATMPVRASCACGRTAIEARGAPILSAVCYCESCRTAARQFEQAPGAPTVLEADGGVAYCLFRKDRVRIACGGEHLQEHRLTETSPTRRIVAACCNTPLFLDFTRGHWLNLNRARLTGDPPPIEMGVMGKERPGGTAHQPAWTIYSTHPPKFMIKLLASWAAMGFRRPTMMW